MTEDELREIAAENGVQIVDCLPLPANESLAVETESGCYIGLDNGLTGANKKAHLAHELGHCVKGALYRPAEPLRTRSRCEYRARKWMYEKLLPLDRLEAALLSDVHATLADVAEALDVPEAVLRGAIRHYARLGQLIHTFGRGREALPDPELSALRTHVIGRLLLYG